MSNQQGQSSLVSKLTLLVLVLILGCLLALLFKTAGTDPVPVEQTIAAEVNVPVPEVMTTNVIVVMPPATQEVRRALSIAPSAPVLPPADVLVPPNAPPVPPSSVAQPLPPPVPAAVQPSGAPAPSGIAADVRKTLQYVALPSGSEMRLDGKATGKTWHCIGKIITGSFEVEAAWLANPAATNVAQPRCEVQIPIRTLKSQVGVGATTMDKRMQLEMKAASFPTIHYRLRELTLSTNAPSNRAAHLNDVATEMFFNAKGDLALAGVTNSVVFPIALELMGGGAIHIAGVFETRMTAFGIRPPAFTVMGLGLTCADEVSLTWHWFAVLRHDAAGR